MTALVEIKIVDLATVRMERAGWDRLPIDRVAPGVGGCVVVLSGERRYAMTPAEARTLARDLLSAAASTERQRCAALGFVHIAWCDAAGRPTTCHHSRARIVERTATAARLVHAPAPWEGTRLPHGAAQVPTGEWWVRLDGWPVGHPPKRRGWRVVGGAPLAQEGER